MKNLTAKQVNQVRTITGFEHTNFHGNRKRVGVLTVEQFRAIHGVKRSRYIFQNKYTAPNPTQLTRNLIDQNRRAFGTPYFKLMIEGDTGIYLASPVYKHKDYNKTRLFDKTPYTLRLLELYNNYFNKHA
jgi:hypothetical protein